MLKGGDQKYYDKITQFSIIKQIKIVPTLKKKKSMFLMILKILQIGKKK